MEFRAFKEQYERYPVIRSAYFSLDEKPAYLRRLVSEWTKKEWLIELRRGMYLVNESHVLAKVERFALANLIYEPSYVSLESALSFHGMIPEAVSQVTSVGTRKTARFTNVLGTFTYSNIKKELLWGYSRTTMGEGTAFVASPEKAILDLVYLRRGELKSAEELVESLRLENLERVGGRKLLAAAKRFDNAKVLRVAEELSKLLTKKRGKA
jgi:predicted transcriptional regulator of viral defense system